MLFDITKGLKKEVPLERSIQLKYHSYARLGISRAFEEALGGKTD